MLIVYLRYWKSVLNYFNTENPSPEKLPKNAVSVIIPFRNEECQIPELLNCLQLCDSFDALNFYFINDHSTDKGPRIIQDFNESDVSCKNIFLIDLPENIHGKKEAIRFVVNSINTDWFHIIDADCLPQQQTFELLYKKALENDCKVVLGPVTFTKTSNQNGYWQSAIEWYQIFENTALIALGFYHLKKREPSMGNAANMLVNTAFFKKINPFKYNQSIAGGDDIFLIESAFLVNPNSVKNVNCVNAAVITSVFNNLPDLWNQRIRWAKKTSAQSLSFTRNSQILLLIFFIILWGFTLYSGFYRHEFQFIFLFWGCKIVFDAIILTKLMSNFSTKIPTTSLVFASLFQTIFIPAIAFSQFFLSVKWKDRQYR